jgi:hypothetical protein
VDTVGDKFTSPNSVLNIGEEDRSLVFFRLIEEEDMAGGGQVPNIVKQLRPQVPPPPLSFFALST